MYLDQINTKTIIPLNNKTRKSTILKRKLEKELKQIRKELRKERRLITSVTNFLKNRDKKINKTKIKEHLLQGHFVPRTCFNLIRLKGLDKIVDVTENQLCDIFYLKLK